MDNLLGRVREQRHAALQPAVNAHVGGLLGDAAAPFAEIFVTAVGLNLYPVGDPRSDPADGVAVC